jgi:hypothetical protein
MKGKIVGRVVVLLSAALIVCLSQVGVAWAGGGNSAKAKQCQKNGWQKVFRSDGSSFASEEDCVAYAAQGGSLATVSQLNCQSFGGTYATGTAPVLWTCNGYNTSPASTTTLFLNCGFDGGSLTVVVAGATLDGTCQQR